MSFLFLFLSPSLFSLSTLMGKKLSILPFCFSTSAAIGTVELTGFEITFSSALGHASAHAETKSRTMPALILNRSSRVMPGLRGTPAGMMTTSHPFSASWSWSGPAYPVTTALVLMWERSAATPGVPAMS